MSITPEQRIQFAHNSACAFKSIFSLREESSFAVIFTDEKDGEALIPMPNGTTLDLAPLLWKDGRENQPIHDRDFSEITKAISPNHKKPSSNIIFLPCIDTSEDGHLIGTRGWFSADDACLCLAANLTSFHKGYETTSFVVSYFCTVVAQNRVFLQEIMYQSRTVAGAEKSIQRMIKMDPDISKIHIDPETRNVLYEFIKEDFRNMMQVFVKFMLTKIIRATKINFLLNRERIYYTDILDAVSTITASDTDKKALTTFLTSQIFTIPGILQASAVTTASAITHGIKVNSQDILKACMKQA